MRYTLLFISLFFLACQEEKVPVYSDQDKINFIGTSEDNEDDPEFMFLEKNFLPIQGDTCNYQLQVKVQGKPSNLDRKVCFAVRDSTTPGIGIEFGECIIPAGKLRGTCEVILKRPESNNESISFITFDYNNSDFKKGTYERQQFTIKTLDKISYEILGIHEGWWDENVLSYALGNWSFTKARFICQVLGITDFYAWYNDPLHWDAWGLTCYDRDKLVAALEDYKANPQNPPLYDETLYPEEIWIQFTEY